MKRFYLQFRIALLTFALGLASFWFFDGIINGLKETLVDLPKSKSDSVLNVFVVKEETDFSVYGHGCGGKTKYGGEGYTTSYQTNTLRMVSISGITHSNTQNTKLELDSTLKEAKKIISESKNRIIIENSFDKENWIEIIKLEDKKSLKVLTAPDLELALKFEKWLKDNN